MLISVLDFSFFFVFVLKLSFDSGVEEKHVQTEETSSPPVDAPESESLDLSQEKIGDDSDEPETRLEEEEASPCSSEMKSFSGEKWMDVIK